MSPYVTAGGKLLTLSGKLISLFRDVVQPGSVTPPGPMPTVGMSGWWDASTLPWNTTVNTLTDKNGGAVSASTGGATAVPRQAGVLGGLYRKGSPTAYPFNLSYMLPVILDHAVTANGVTVGAGGTLTVFLAWSRANQRQVDAVYSAATVPLLDVGGTTVLSMTGRGDGTDTLTLFPNGTPQTAGTLELRHTHSVRVVFSGATVDVWLDGAKVISGAANQISLGATAHLSFLNAAQCVFHEAAAWSHALTPSEHTALTTYAGRWPLGPRRAINGVIVGQSNLAYFTGAAYGQFITANRIAYLTGAISANLLVAIGDGRGQIPVGSTIYSGEGLYDFAGSNALFLDSRAGGDPANWPLGTKGNAFMTALDGMTADQRANLRFIAWYWSESDSSLLSPATKATYTAAMRRAFALIRGHLGVTTADKLPFMVINAMPFGAFTAGCQTHREVMQDLVNDATQNVHFMLAQTDDAIGYSNGETWDSATGIEGGPGDGAHRSIEDQAMFARRMAIPIARAALAANAAAGTSDLVTTLDDSIPQLGGPSIATAHYEGTAYAPTGSLLVTIAHDKGTDLIVPRRAAQGVGWTLMDGVSDTVAGTVAAPGALITATSCAKVDASHLRVILASLPSHPTKGLLYFVYGSGLDANSYAVVGRGNAVTDNFASITLADGWRIGSDLGSDEQPNNPLQATTYGVALT
jgi:hypothetical protein